MTTCAYCPEPATTRDHRLPKARARALYADVDDLDMGVNNICPACKTCNNLRGLLFHCPAVLACFHDLRNGPNNPRPCANTRLALIAMGVIFGKHYKIRPPRRADRPTLADVWPTPAEWWADICTGVAERARGRGV